MELRKIPSFNTDGMSRLYNILPLKVIPINRAAWGFNYLGCSSSVHNHLLPDDRSAFTAQVFQDFWAIQMFHTQFTIYYSLSFLVFW